MSEAPPKLPQAPSLESHESDEDFSMEKYQELARELIENSETFPFPGIKPDAYERLKVETAEFPEYSTPIDVLIDRFQKHGMKIVSSEQDVQSGNFFVVPADSTDYLMDNLAPRQLGIFPGMDARARDLIRMSRKHWQETGWL